MMRRWLVLPLAVIGLSAAGCSAAFSHPLSDAESSVIDDRLLGRWKVVDTDAKTGINDDPSTIERDKNSKNVLVIATNERDETTDEPRFVRLYCTKVGERHVVSVLPPPEDKDLFILAAYEFVDDKTVKLSGPSLTLLEHAIKDKQLEGEIDEGGVLRSRNVRITSSPETVRAFIEKNAATFFEPIDALTIRRVAD